MNGRLQSAFAGVVAVCVVQQSASARPPSSLEPGAGTAKLWFHHTHRAVAACTPVPKAAFCAASFEARDAATELWLVPLSTSRPSSLGDSRVPIRVLVGGTSTAQPVQAAPGRWALAWQGYNGRELRLEAGAAVTFALQTTTGKCERVSRKCRMNPDVTTRTVARSAR